MSRTSAILLLALATICLLASCRGKETEPAAPVVATPTPASASAPLPRLVADLALGAPREAVENRLGPLTCRDAEGGLQVCTPEYAPPVRELQIYLFEGRAVSITYEIEPPANAWTFLDGQVAKYGKPSLTSKRELDQIGREHETFGWKDDDSLYSVRFIWGPDEQGNRRLLGTVIALWDRRAYQAWEKATQAPRG